MRAPPVPSAPFTLTINSRQVFFVFVGAALLALFVFLAGVQLGKHWVLSANRPPPTLLQNKHLECIDWASEQVRQKTGTAPAL